MNLLTDENKKNVSGFGQYVRNKESSGKLIGPTVIIRLINHFLKKKEGVAAVVSTKQELISALNSQQPGIIVVYGKINVSQTLTLNNNQKLVGVGYFGSYDSEVNKFSKLNINTSDNGIYIAGATDTEVADLSIRFSATQVNKAAIKYGQASNRIGNLDIEVLSENSYGIAGSANIGWSSWEMYGTNNIRLGQTGIGIQYAQFTIGGNSVLNISSQNDGSSFSSRHIAINAEGTSMMTTIARLLQYFRNPASDEQRLHKKTPRRQKFNLFAPTVIFRPDCFIHY